MATVVQTVVSAGFNDTASVNFTVPGVASGNSIILVCPLYGDNTPSEPSATSYTLARRASIANGSSSRAVSVMYRHNCPSGDNSITVNTSGAAGFRYGYAIAMEVSGLSNAAPNVTMPAASGTNGANDSSPATGTSGATSVANCFIVAAMTLAAGTADAGIDTPATTGYSNRGVRQISTSEVAYSVDTKSVTSTGTQSAAWGTLSASAEWSAVLVAFEEIAGPTINTQPTNQTCYVGETATFTISATTSGGTLSYQWKDDGSNVGTNSNSYTTGTATLSDNGAQITCAVTDDNGTTTSNAATWTVLPAARLSWIRA